MIDPAKIERRGWKKGRPRIPVHERIAKLSAPQPDGCILYTGEAFYNKWRRGKDLYGRIKINGKNLLAHRVAWTIKNGPIPDGLFVLHKCDVRRCINTEHLFLGTQKDNMQDCSRKGRARRNPVRGEDVPTAKLKSEQVFDIRKKYAEGLSSIKIADIYKGIIYMTPYSLSDHRPARFSSELVPASSRACSLASVYRPARGLRSGSGLRVASSSC
jgi:hypothetical protein